MRISENFENKRLIFVTGKGGVGKSVCAAAIAYSEARKGRKVCLFELGGESFYEPFFETRGIQYDPIEVMPDVHISLLTPDQCIREYALQFLKVPKLYDIFFQNKVMKAFLNAAPAVSEISILGKVTGEIREILKPEYDLFVVDCYSTGHALALFRAPEGLRGAFKSGPLADQSADILKVLKNPELTHYTIVTLPEEMPVAETEEFHEILKDEFNADISIICNKVLISPIDSTDEKELENQVHDQSLHEFLEYLEFKEEIQGAALQRLHKLTDRVKQVPLLTDVFKGQEFVEEFARHLNDV